MEKFLKNRAIIYEKQDIARTSIVIDDNEVLGYFTIANKPFSIESTSWNRLSNSRRKQLVPDKPQESNKPVTPQSLLLGQVGKNFDSKRQLAGDELLDFAEQELYKAYQYGGGRFFWLECLNNDFIISFYERNGYQKFEEGDEYCLMIKKIKA